MTSEVIKSFDVSTLNTLLSPLLFGRWINSLEILTYNSDISRRPYLYVTSKGSQFEISVLGANVFLYIGIQAGSMYDDLGSLSVDKLMAENEGFTNQKYFFIFKN